MLNINPKRSVVINSDKTSLTRMSEIREGF